MGFRVGVQGGVGSRVAALDLLGNITLKAGTWQPCPPLQAGTLTGISDNPYDPDLVKPKMRKYPTSPVDSRLIVTGILTL